MPITIQPTTFKYKNGSTFTSADCLKGDPGDPTELIDDTAGEGDTDKTWSADKLDSEFSAATHIVPVFSTDGNGDYICDMTYAQVYSAVQNKQCTSAFNSTVGVYLFLDSANNNGVWFKSFDKSSAEYVLINYYSIRNDDSVDILSIETDERDSIANYEYSYDTSSHAYSVGDLFMYCEYNDSTTSSSTESYCASSLRRAIANIAVGDAITHNNCERTTIANEFSSVNSALQQSQEDIDDVKSAIGGKADKVTSATNGHFAGLDSNGNLTDSGKSASDFGTYSKPSGGIPASDIADGVIPDVYTYPSIAQDSSASGWRLTESSGLCYADASYKLVKYKVVAGDTVKVVSSDRFQFQTVASVPASGTSNRVGDTTYGAGTFTLVVPETATYLVASTLTDGSFTVGKRIVGNVEDVQVNGTSVVTNGVANVPVGSAGTLGVVKTHATNIGLSGISITDGMLAIAKATSDRIKAGTNNNMPIVPANQNEATFYGLAKCAGDSSQSSSSNAVGTYTDTAKQKINAMLEPKFRKIKEITITEATGKIYVNTDDNGSPFSLTEMVLYFEQVVADNNAGTGGICVNNGNYFNGSGKPYLYIGNMYMTTAKNITVNMWVRGGKFFAEGTLDGLAQEYTRSAKNTSRNATGIIDCDPITELCIGSANAYNYTSGKITIYGR